MTLDWSAYLQTPLVMVAHPARVTARCYDESSTLMRRWQVYRLPSGEPLECLPARCTRPFAQRLRLPPGEYLLVGGREGEGCVRQKFEVTESREVGWE